MIDQNKLLSRVLLLGILTSVGLMSLGLSLYFLLSWSSLAIVNLGILVLIATPVLRVLAALVTFAVNGEKFYVFISTLVLSILLVSFLIA